jgi:hypothetical protein
MIALLLACSASSAPRVSDGGAIRGREPAVVTLVVDAKPGTEVTQDAQGPTLGADVQPLDAIRVPDVMPVDAMPVDVVPTVKFDASVIYRDVRRFDDGPSLVWDGGPVDDAGRQLCPVGNRAQWTYWRQCSMNSAGTYQCVLGQIDGVPVGQACFFYDRNASLGSWLVHDCDLCPALPARGAL